MGKIKILPEAVINKIAAGEVVERPASAVKELVENSLDARATAVAVFIRGDGLKAIRVEDNGEGMEKADLLLAFERHSTSKIRDFSDLEKLASLGFRGEALPSIAGVSDLELTSRPRGTLAATRVRVTAGAIRDVTEVGAPEGTTVEVRRLFFNTPARRKFLKSPRTEMGHISSAVTALALAHPGVAFKLSREGEVLFAAPQTSDIRQRVCDVWGREAGERLLPLEGKAEGVRISGFICLPELAPTHRKGFYLFVNSRPVYNRMIVSALLEGYGPLLPKHAYPMGVLFMGIPGAEVDVNIHPAKREVRFLRAGMVRSVVVAAAVNALNRQRPGRSFFAIAARGPAEGVKEGKRCFSAAPEEMTFEEAGSVEAATLQPSVSAALPVGEGGGLSREEPRPEFRVVGQVKNSYVIAETTDGLILIDQHAAHERILYERFVETFRQEPVEIQPLLAPLTLELGPREAALLLEKAGVLKSLGIEVEPFGGRAYAVTALPAILAGRGKEELVLEAIGDIEDWEKEPGDPREKVITRLACAAAVKAKSWLGELEMPELVKRLLECRTPSVCPHGRPTMLTFEWAEVERRFGRK